MSTGQESREQLFWWGSFLVAYIHSPNHHRERHDLHLQVTVCFCDQVAYKHSANQKLWCPHCPPPHHHYPDIWHLIKITRISTHRCACLSCITCTCITWITCLIHVLFALLVLLVLLTDHILTKNLIKYDWMTYNLKSREKRIQCYMITWLQYYMGWGLLQPPKVIT